MRFKIGQVVQCVNINFAIDDPSSRQYNGVTVGKNYVVEDCWVSGRKAWIRITNDYDGRAAFAANRFRAVSAEADWTPESEMLTSLKPVIEVLY